MINEKTIEMRRISPKFTWDLGHFILILGKYIKAKKISLVKYEDLVNDTKIYLLKF